MKKIIYTVKLFWYNIAFIVFFIGIVNYFYPDRMTVTRSSDHLHMLLIFFFGTSFFILAFSCFLHRTQVYNWLIHGVIQKLTILDEKFKFLCLNRLFGLFLKRIFQEEIESRIFEPFLALWIKKFKTSDLICNPFFCILKSLVYSIVK